MDFILSMFVYFGTELLLLNIFAKQETFFLYSICVVLFVSLPYSCYCNPDKSLHCTNLNG